MRFTKKEQFKLLEQLNTRELEDKFGAKELRNIFDVTVDEYYKWEIKQPIRSDVCTEEATYDGIYFLDKGNEWEVFWKERGGYCFGQHLKTKNYNEARYFLSKLIIPDYIRMPKR